ncbi:MAG: KH domain-containing protein [Patescibacteria group bacterium]|nr:KH domain-containing protein [Patescibacteria group bacterium]
MKNLIEYILIHIVENPEDVKIETEPNEQGTTYIITVHPDDMGRVIGKKGSIIQSIRAICRVRAMKEGERANIIVADPLETGTTPAQPESSSNSDPSEAKAPDAEPEVIEAPVEEAETEEIPEDTKASEE